MQQNRLRESILAIYPDANLLFLNEPEVIGKNKFQQSLYGFKPKLVRYCLEMGFKKIIFFDPAICLEGKIDHWFELIKDYGVLAIKDRNPLPNFVSNTALQYVGLSREQASDIHLVGGSVYVFDFDVHPSTYVFKLWEQMEINGIFGTQDDLSHDRLQGHRNDEACMALAMNNYKVKPVTYDQIGYGFVKPDGEYVGAANATIVKRHFK